MTNGTRRYLEMGADGCLSQNLFPQPLLQHFWYCDSPVSALVLLQDRGEESARRQPRSIQSMQIFGSPSAAAKTNVASARLIVPGVRSRAHFFEFIHARNPDLDVVCSRHRSARVSGRQFAHSMVESQSPNQFLRFADQFLKSRVRVLRSRKGEHLHFVELMSPDAASLLHAIATSLPPITRGISKISLWQLVLFQNFVAM